MTQQFSHLLPAGFKSEVAQWIKDDCPATDIGGFVVGEKFETANLYCKSSGVLAGLPFAQAVFEFLNLECEWLYEEGTYIDVNNSEISKVKVAVVSGKCRNILLSERTSLNILSRASGVASAARRAYNIKVTNQWHGFVAGTRKTTPGFRNVEKYALLVGGVSTHRLDLSQMVMLKDNHIWSCGSITNAVQKAKLAAGFSIKIEVYFCILYYYLNTLKNQNIYIKKSFAT
jgi:nicotinate-nucleotide pyrophosphorylase (carboxylating)